MSNFFYPNRRILTFTKKGLVEDKVVTSTDKSVTGNDATLSHAGLDGMIMMSTDAAAKITEKAVEMSFDKWEAEILKNPSKQTPSNKGTQGNSASSKPTSGIPNKQGFAKTSSSTSLKKKATSSTSTTSAKKTKTPSPRPKTPTNMKKDQKKAK